jgi:hypothetical protein
MQYLPLGFSYHEKRSQIYEQFRKEHNPSYLYGNEDSPHPWSVIWILYNDYFVENNYVVCTKENKVIFSTPIYNAHVVIGHLHVLQGDVKRAIEEVGEPWFDFEPQFNFDQIIKHYKVAVPKEEKDNGQLKLLTNALEILDSPGGKLVVIGGGGPYYGTSGLTYHSIGEIDKTRKIEIYDPVDVPGHIENVTVKAEYFDYDTNKVFSDVTHVIDDAYYPENCDVSHPDHYLIDDIPMGYNGKFVVAVENNFQILVATPRSHSNHNYTWVLGGGEIQKLKDKVVVYGTSGKYGPYDRARIKKYFSSWIVMPSTKFKNSANYEKLKRIFPNAAITVKAVESNDMYKDAEIREQHFYTGNEKRAYFKSNLIPLCGLECMLCHYVHKASHRMRVHVNQIRDLFVKVGNVSCLPYKHKNKTYAINLLSQYCRRWSEEKMIVAEMQRKTNYTDKAILGMLDFMVRHGKVKRLHAYDGIRYVKHIYLGNENFLPPSQLKNFLIGLSAYYDSYLIGDYVSGEGQHMLYVGNNHFSQAVGVVPIDMPMKVLVQYEITHEVHDGYTRVLLRKDVKRKLKPYVDFFKELSRWIIDEVEWELDSIRWSNKVLYFDGTMNQELMLLVRGEDRKILSDLLSRMNREYGVKVF